MVKILLCCSAGMSTSMVVQKMEKYAQQADLQAEILAVSLEEFRDTLPRFDCCLLGPQIKYKLAEFKQVASEFNIPVDVINPMDYGMLNGEKIFKSALSLIAVNKGAV